MNPRLTVQGHLKLREVILPKVTLPGSGRAFGLQITKGDLSRMSLGQVTLHFDGLYYKMIQKTLSLTHLFPLNLSLLSLEDWYRRDIAQVSALQRTSPVTCASHKSLSASISSSENYPLYHLPRAVDLRNEMMHARVLGREPGPK